MKTKINAFHRISIESRDRTVEQLVADWQDLFRLDDPIVNGAVCASLIQRIKVANGMKKDYWIEVLNAIKSLS